MLWFLLLLREDVRREKYGLQKAEARDSFADDAFFDPDAPAYHEAPGICGCDCCMCIVACNYDKSGTTACSSRAAKASSTRASARSSNLARLGCCGAAPANAVMIRAPPSVAKAIRVFDKTGVADIKGDVSALYGNKPTAAAARPA